MSLLDYHEIAVACGRAQPLPTHWWQRLIPHDRRGPRNASGQRRSQRWDFPSWDELLSARQRCERELERSIVAARRAAWQAPPR